MMRPAPPSSLLLPQHQNEKDKVGNQSDENKLNSQPIVKRKFERSMSESESGSALLNRRIKKFGVVEAARIRSELSMKQEVCKETKLANLLYSRLYSLVLEKATDPIESENGVIRLYNVNDGKRTSHKVFVHSLVPEVSIANNDKVLEEDFCQGFWELFVKEDVGKIIALAYPDYRPRYMPFHIVKDDSGNEVRSIQVGDLRVFNNGFEIRVKEINELKALLDLANKKHEAEVRAPLAREVVLELTWPSPNQKSVQKRTVIVDQILNCWHDNMPQDSNVSMAIVDRIPDNMNIQVHCEGGMHRSPAAVVMWLLNQHKDDINNENLMDYVADTVLHVRSVRKKPDAMNVYALESIIRFTLKVTGLSAESVLSANEKHPAPHTAPVEPTQRFQFAKGITGEASTEALLQVELFSQE